MDIRKKIAMTGSVILWFGVLAAGPGFGQEPGTNGDRFVIQRAADGYIRLDRQTGATSFCQVRTGSLSCAPSAQERETYETRLAQLEVRVRDLEQALAERQNGANSGERAQREEPPMAGGPEGDATEFEKSLNFAERALRRFFSVIKEMKSDLEKGASG